MIDMNIEHFKERIHSYLTRRKALILIYHGVISSSLEFDMWTQLPLPNFECQMDYLRQHFKVISLQQLAEGISGNSVPENAVCLTFDDGFANNYHHAYPVLKKFNLPATIFLATGHVDQGTLFWPEHLAYLLMKTTRKELVVSFGSFPLDSPSLKKKAFIFIRDHLKAQHPKEIDLFLRDMEQVLGIQLNAKDPLYTELGPLDWSQVREMYDSGLISFGGHTVNHCILSRLNKDEAESEVSGCRGHLDENLPQRTILWAYPNGRFSDFLPDHKGMLQHHGFDVLLTTEPEYVTTCSEISQLGRWGISADIKQDHFRRIVHKCNWLSQMSVSEKFGQILGNIF